MNLSKVPKKQRRMVERLMRDSVSVTSLAAVKRGKAQAWESMLAKAGHEFPVKQGA